MRFYQGLNFVVVFIVVVYQGAFAIENGAQYILEAGKRDCFYRDITEGTKIDFDAQVLSGGELDIGIELKAPSGEKLIDEQRATELDKEFEAKENGTYELCFDNSFSIVTDKVVYFDLGISQDDENANDILPENIEKDKMSEDQPEASTVVKTLQGLHKKMEEIILLQAIHRAKEARHRKTAEGNFTRVTWFSVASCILMVSVGILQVVIVRNLFSEKRGIKA